MDDTERIAKAYPGWKVDGKAIGRGGFSKVYRIVKEDEFGTKVYSALKTITVPESDAELEAYRDDGYDNESLTTLFKSRVVDITSELVLMNKLKGNSHIVSYEDHAIVQHDNDPGYDIFIRMELLTTLPEYYSQISGKEHMVEKAAVKLGLDVCRALELCQRNGIIHRDIKPQNIFINDNGDFKLGDFGIAKVSDHTTKATKAGTYGYMAPEVYWGKPYNASIDLYSLGMVLYWLLNERRGPFLPLPPTAATPSQNDSALHRRMQGEQLPAPKNGSEALKSIVLKACAADPKDRFSSAAEMRLALSQLESDEPSSAKNEGHEEETTNEDETIAGIIRDTQPIKSKPAQSPAMAGNERIAGNYHEIQSINSKAAPAPVVTWAQSDVAKEVAAAYESSKNDPVASEKNRSTQETVAVTSNTKTILYIACGAVALLLIFLALRGKSGSSNQQVYTESNNSSASFSSYSSSSSSSSSNSSNTTRAKAYSLDEYMQDQGRSAGEKYSSASAYYYWKKCKFTLPHGRGSWGPEQIAAAGSNRNNAIVIMHSGNADRFETIEGTSYPVAQGSITLSNPGYDTFSYSLGALSNPSDWYGGTSTHGYFRVTVNGTTSGWIKKGETQSCSAYISNASQITITVEFACGTGGSLNAVLFDAKFK